ncbi:hypothetical protein [Paenibacillus bovis]|uniref:Uncharacterized protein n=1 Tax=Paenibacillus bovis TaxID=1616788 RepID=A0A172ZHA3_9BACL|nr:hypothetical protein [Paenibacillus bovis]ANF97016.1 hypothetical protein AR543_14050 [Paenibacillus bovis]
MSQDITQFEWYQMLNGKVSPDILYLKNSSNNYLWNEVHLLNIKYLTKNVVRFPWVNHFALAVLSTTNRKLNPISINNMISSLHARFRDVFEAYELKAVKELRDHHIIGLINSEICITLTDRQRSNFVSHYKTFYYNISKWIREKLTEEELQNISSYILPEFAFDHNDFKVRQQAIDKAHKKRKDQTSAVAPLLPSIRA